MTENTTANDIINIIISSILNGFKKKLKKTHWAVKFSTDALGENDIFKFGREG